MAHTRHENPVFSGGKSPAYVAIVIGDVSASLYVFSRVHLYVQYSSLRKKLLKEEFVMAEVVSLRNSVLVGHGDLQHADTECLDEHCILYHSYPIPKNHELPYATGLHFAENIALELRKAAVSAERGPDQQEAGSDEDMVVAGGSY